MALKNSREGGYALIMALLALILLTFLAMTLASMTSIETRIAANHRAGEQARFTAEAGTEAAKRILRDVDWQTLLPAPRRNGGNLVTWTAASPAAAPAAVSSRTDTFGNPSRNFELGACDGRGGQVGYGVVLDDGTAAGPYQNVSTLLGQPMGGLVTFWVRRATTVNANGAFADDPNNDKLILTVEAMAPGTSNPNSTHVRRTRSTYRIETTLQRALDEGRSSCGTRAGQAGGGQEGANVGTCDPLSASGLTAAAGQPVTELDERAR